MWERIAPCSKVSTTSVPGKVTQRNMFREIFSNIQVIQKDINKLEQRTSTMRVIEYVSLYSNSKKAYSIWRVANFSTGTVGKEDN